MQVTRIGWAGTRTGGYSAMADFLTAVLGLTLARQEPDFAVLDLPSGDTFEVFGPSDQDHQHFTTGPVVGFVVEDLPAAVAQAWRAFDEDGRIRDDMVAGQLAALGAEVVRAARQMAAQGRCDYSEPWQ